MPSPKLVNMFLNRYQLFTFLTKKIEKHERECSKTYHHLNLISLSHELHPPTSMKEIVDQLISQFRKRGKRLFHFLFQKLKS